MIGGASVGGRLAPVARTLTAPRLAVALGPLVAVILGYAIATGRLKYAVVLLILPAAVWVLSRPLGGLMLGLVLILTVPSWLGLGSPQLAVLRLAPLCAMTAILTARGFRPNRIDSAVVTLVLVSALSVAIQGAPGAGKVLLNEMIVLGFYVAARVVRAQSALRVMTVGHLAGVLGALTVIYEWRTGHVIFSNPSSYSWNASATTIFRPGGIFGSPPGAATVLAVTALLGLPALRAASAPRVRLGLSLSLLVTLVACFLTLTRASLIGFAVGLAVYLWLSRSSLVTPVRLAIGALTVLLLVIVVIPIVSPSRTAQEALVRPGNLATREAIWRLALPVVTDTPAHLAFGLGAESTVVADQGGPAPAGLSTSPDLVSIGTHNQYVLVLLEQGLVGLAVLIMVLATMLLAGMKTATRLGGSPTIGAATGAVAAIAITGLANNLLLDAPSFAVLALAGGLLAARLQVTPSPSVRP